jgi:hypothetical protein
VCKREVDIASLGLGLEDEQELLALVQTLVNVNKVEIPLEIPVDDQMSIRPVYPEGFFIFFIFFGVWRALTCVRLCFFFVCVHLYI